MTVAPAHSWYVLAEHLNKWFYKPDLEALEIVLSVTAAHYSTQTEPVWLFVVGPSGSGKTAICVQAISTAPRAHVQGAMTPQTLLSFYAGKSSGLLVSPIGKNGLLLFKDFTTILTMRDEARSEIVGQLREVFDGKWQRATGVGSFLWEGKVTVVAACTPALERAWSTHRDMGERFLTVRWPRIGGRDLALAAGKQQGHEREIAEKTATLGRGIVTGLSPTLPELNERQIEEISCLAELVARLRPQVPRSKGGNEIIEMPGCEEPGRIHKGLSLIVRAHAALFRREPEEDDMRLARRVARDSVPLKRLSLLIRMKPGEKILAGTLAGRSNQPASTVKWNLEDLQALRIVQCETMENGDNAWSLQKNFLTLNSGAGFTEILKSSGGEIGNEE